MLNVLQRRLGHRLKSATARLKFRAAYLIFWVDSRRDNSVLLFGEKGGLEARDNAFALFKHLYDAGRRDVFFVSSRHQRDQKNLDPYTSNIVIMGSWKHIRTLLRARLALLNDGWRDIYPPHGYYLKRTDTPFIYLRHGITRYKTIYFTSSHYTGRIIRFVISLDSELDIVLNQMMSKPDFLLSARMEVTRRIMGLERSTFTRAGLLDFSHRLTELAEDGSFGEREAKRAAKAMSRTSRRVAVRIGFPTARVIQTGLARHDAMQREFQKKENRRRYISIFFTWRDYWPSINQSTPLSSTEYYKTFSSLFLSEKFFSFLEEKDLVARLYVHNKMHEYLPSLLSLSHSRLEICKTLDGIQDTMLKSVALITDYSSISFDYSLAGAGVLFFQPDHGTYYQHRGDYTTSASDWIGPIITKAEDVVSGLKEAISTSGHQRSRLINEYPNFGSSCKAIANEIENIPPRVLFICYNIFGIGGTVRSVINSANYLYHRGYHVEIISLRRTKLTPTLQVHPSIKIHSLFESSFTEREKISSFRKLLSRYKSFIFDRNDDLYRRTNLLMDIRLIQRLRTSTADVIIPTIPSLAKAAVLFSRRNATVLVQEHKFLGARHLSVRRLIERYYPRAAGLMTLTEADGAEYREALGMRCFTVPNGTPSVEDDTLPLRDPHTPRRVIALGRLNAQKQFDLLIQAFAQTGMLGWELHIFGEGEERANLEALVHSLGLTDAVFLRGSTSNSQYELAVSDICAVTSTYEGFGMTFIEAYALGKSVITFDIERGPKEIVIDEVTGLKATPFDVSDYAAKLRRLMMDEELRKALGESGRRLWQERFTIETAGARLESAINSVKTI